jgi:hypothetical protein
MVVVSHPRLARLTKPKENIEKNILMKGLKVKQSKSITKKLLMIKN